MFTAGSPLPELAGRMHPARFAAARLQGFALAAFGFWLEGCPWVGSSLPICS
jgi:hypothetical protein